MAKHISKRLLRPSQAINASTATTITTPPPLLPIRRDPGPLPESTVLYRKPIHPGPPLPESCNASDLPTLHHGQHIYLYNNIFTNQVIYSLTRHLNNAASLSQLPFLGKKTQPSHLRKDLWTPFALATFPSAHAGINAYRKLREFRRLHETAYPLEIIKDPGSPRSLLPKHKRGRVLMNQKANSIADLAAVLLQQEAGLSQQRLERWERVSRRVRRALSQRKLAGDEEEKVKTRRKQRLEKVDVVKELQGVTGVKVHWVDMRDAEFAERWPAEVVHERLGKSRYTAAWPAREASLNREDVRAKRVAEEAVEASMTAEEAEHKAPDPEDVVPAPKRTWRERLFWTRKSDAAAGAT